MPLTVEYAEFDEGIQFSSRSFLYGVEYETQESPLQSFHNHDVPCAVCVVKQRSESLMIPGQDKCPIGWRREYSGFLVSSPSAAVGNNTQQNYRNTFECLDGEPERFIGGAADVKDVGLFVLVEADSSTLPCPPHFPGVEVPCVMCSKLP